MNRNGIIAIAAVLVVFAVAGGILIARTTGGGGRTVSYDVAVSGTTMTPSDLQARLGDTVTISITGDKAEEVHLHVYDLKFELKPGQPVTHTFKADKTCGPCDIEIEDSGTPIGGLTVKP